MAMSHSPADMRGARPRGWRALIGPAIATLISMAILVGLGSWQLARLEWKRTLIEQIETRARGAPGEILPESAWAAYDPQEQEYRRVALEGRFLNEFETPVHGLLPSSIRGQPVQGHYLLTPFQLDTGAIIIVNRGFVPSELRDPESRPGSLVEGPGALVGLVRAPQEKHYFVPDNDPATGNWFTRDPAQIARAHGLARVAPFYVDAEHVEGAPQWPRAGATALDLPNNHLHYAFTWFGLAFTLLAVFVAFSWRWLQGRPD